MRPSREARRDVILAAALDLASRRGFRQAGMDEIGAAAGYTGPALYRYFRSKSDLLVALHERLIDMQLVVTEDVRVLVEQDPTAALALLVRSHAASVLENLDLYRLYLHERSELPHEDARRLQRKLDPYLEIWRAAIQGHAASVAPEEVRGLQGAVIGVLHSPIDFAPALPNAELALMLERAAWRVLGRDDPPSN